MYFCTFFIVAQQEKEAVDVKGQLQSIVGDLSLIKSSMETIRQGGKRQKKAIPRELSVRLGEYLCVQV